MPASGSSPCFHHERRLLDVEDLCEILIIVCFFLLIIVLVPGIGMERNGSRSWIGVGAFSIQPSEFMKLAMIAFWPSFI
ncbi:FtsW/RodA/SpoVE family cell cycle protein [Bacillus licheniformis]|nr:FtsW/RodA/SpoVE family cell cycle protein [Bacillus licheniformis]